MLLPTAHQTESAIGDIIGGARAWRFWTLLGWSDIRQRYRRSAFGPFWITISMGLMTAALGVIYGSIFKMQLADYMAYLAAGITAWLFFSSTLSEAASAFIGAEGIIKQCSIPLSVHIYRAIWRNLIVFAHNAVVLVVVFIFLGNIPLINPLALLVGLVLVSANLFVGSLLVATLCTRFRDIPPLISSVMQLLFFVTPILFAPAQLPPQLKLIASFNPVYHLIDVLRRPMIGELASVESYIFAVVLLMVVSALCALLFFRFRPRIAYWL